MASAACCVICQSNENIQWCARCQLVAYCSRDHQKQHWKHHKKICSKTLNKEQSESQTEVIKSIGKNVSDLKLNGQVNQSDSLKVTTLQPKKTSSLLWTAQNSVPMEPFNEAEMTDQDTKKVEGIWAQMQQIGLCIVDDFLPSDQAETLLEEVRNLYGIPGTFSDGEIVKQGSNLGTQRIRSDQIVWIDEDYSQCQGVGLLCKRIDHIIHLCSKLHKCKVLNRTKPMLSCYPGNGTHYKKHVDNPYGDGRLITCLYYLNKGWSCKTDGGALCMYPKGLKKKVVCEPLFNRMLMFFSDQRNPHEVLPAFKQRFAISCWYFDQDERERALQQWSKTIKPSTSK